MTRLTALPFKTPPEIGARGADVSCGTGGGVDSTLGFGVEAFAGVGDSFGRLSCELVELGSLRVAASFSLGVAVDTVGSGVGEAPFA